MESQGLIAALIPLWILGAPCLMALFELLTAPRPPGRRTRSTGAGAAPRTVAPGRL